MAYDALLQAIEHFGHYAFFIVLCLGLVGLPVPNEVVVLTAGALSASGYLSAVPAFAMTFLGVCSAMTVGYSVGRFAGVRLLRLFERRAGIRRFIGRSEELTRRYGGFAICISLMLPVLRHVTTYAVGLNRMPYPRFAVFAYPAALIWTAVYYSLGLLVGEHIKAIGTGIGRYGPLAAAAVAAAAAVYFAVKRLRRSRTPRPEENNGGTPTPRRPE